MPKTKKSQGTQISMNLDSTYPESPATAKQRFYDVLVQLKSQEGTDGHTAEQIAKIVRATGFRVTRVQARGVLKNLVFERHAISKIVAGRRRYFLGTNPYKRHREQGVSIEVLRALKALALSKDNPKTYAEGYTNAGIWEFMVCGGSTLEKGQVSRATSRCRQLGLIGTKSFKGHRGHRTDVFWWTYSAQAEAMIQDASNIRPRSTPTTRNLPPAETNIANRPPELRWTPPVETTSKPKRVATPLTRQLRKLHDQTKHIIGKALMGRDIPPAARTEAFGVIDAFDALLGKL